MAHGNPKAELGKHSAFNLVMPDVSQKRWLQRNLRLGRPRLEQQIPELASGLEDAVIFTEESYSHSQEQKCLESND